MELVIKNCNCIKKADIYIEPNCLNIKYAINGAGKSTISKANTNEKRWGYSARTRYNC